MSSTTHLLRDAVLYLLLLASRSPFSAAFIILTGCTIVVLYFLYVHAIVSRDRLSAQLAYLQADRDKLARLLEQSECDKKQMQADHALHTGIAASRFEDDKASIRAEFSRQLKSVEDRRSNTERRRIQECFDADRRQEALREALQDKYDDDMASVRRDLGAMTRIAEHLEERNMELQGWMVCWKDEVALVESELQVIFADFESTKHELKARIRALINDTTTGDSYGPPAMTLGKRRISSIYEDGPISLSPCKRPRWDSSAMDADPGLDLVGDEDAYSGELDESDSGSNYSVDSDPSIYSQYSVDSPSPSRPHNLALLDASSLSSYSLPSYSSFASGLGGDLIRTSTWPDLLSE